MPCTNLELVSLYADGELDPSARARLEEHIQACAPCQHALEEILRVRRTIESYSLPADPFALRRALNDVRLLHARRLWNRSVAVPVPVLVALVAAVAA